MKRYGMTALAAGFVFSPFMISAQIPGPASERTLYADDLSLVRNDSPITAFVTQEHHEAKQLQAYDQAPEAIRMVDPTYPEAARQQKLEGTVWIKMWIDEGGRPGKISIARSDAEIFNESAIQAAMQWQFKPATLKGKPIGVWLSMPIRFRLSSSQTGNKQEPLDTKKSGSQEVVSLPENQHVRIWIQNGWINAERKNAKGELIWRIPLFKSSSAGLPLVSKQENTLVVRDSEEHYILKDDLSEFVWGASLRVVRDPAGNAENLQFNPTGIGLKYGGGMASSGNRYCINWKQNGWSLISTGATSGASVGLVVRLCYEDFAEEPGMHGTMAGSFYALRGKYRFYDDGSFLFAQRMGDRFVVQKRDIISKLTLTEPPTLSAQRWYNTSAISLKELKGKVVLLAFVDCRDPGAFGQLAQVSYLLKLLEKKGLAAIAIQLRVADETVDRYLMKSPTDLPLAIDNGKTGDSYKVMPDGVVKYHAEGPPSYFVIDKKGQIRKALLVGIPDKSYLEELLKE